jgi:hypothetical protein
VTRKAASCINFSRYAVAATAVTLAQEAAADFSGPYTLNPPPNNTYTGAAALGTFGQWASSLTFTDPSVIDQLVTNAPTSVQLALNNVKLTPTAIDTFDLTTTVAATGALSFDWNFQDLSNGVLSTAISFGYTLNGAFVQLATTTSQTGTTVVPVTAADTFGFRLVANYGGNGTVTITNFAAAVPEPAISFLVASGAVGLLVLRATRCRRKSC